MTDIINDNQVSRVLTAFNWVLKWQAVRDLNFLSKNEIIVTTILNNKSEYQKLINECKIEVWK